MSLYREARSRRRGRLWLAAGAALVVAAVIVAAVLLRGGEPSAAERLESLQKDVRPALAALELVPLNYRSNDEPTRAAAAEQLRIARDTLERLELDLRRIDAAATTRVLSGLARLESLMSATGREAAVAREAAAADAELRRLVGLD